MAATSMTGSLVEFRLLEGPNLYFPRPAAKVTVNIEGLLRLPTAQARELAAELDLGRSRPGPPGSVFRQRFAGRAVAQLVRSIARAGGVTRLAVRARPGADVSELVLAYPWRNSARAEALGRAVADVLDQIAASGEAGPGLRLTEAIQEQGVRLRATTDGRRPQLLRPKVPVVAITGTNGKTTTARMIGFIAQRAEVLVGWSSTDGVYIDGKLVEAGDYSGPGGAARVLSYPGVQLAVTETARGGILRRGVGVAWNDVSVVTNITADHLGLGGINTLDQLAEVKAVITKITKPTGWCVLNADDPRTFAMRLGTKARVWVFSRDADSPAGRKVLDEGGRFTTLLGGWVGVLESRTDPLPVVEIIDVPMTLAGLSRVNVENVLGVASAALALGFDVSRVAAGLGEFDPGENNPGRMNIWTVPVAEGTITVVIDLAHNEAGLEALLEIMNGIRPPGGRLLLGVGTAGDRTDDVFVRLGQIAAIGAEVVEIAHKQDYLRGRTTAELGALIKSGAADAGMQIEREHSTETDCLASLVGQASAGDVVAVMTHQDRDQVDAWLGEHSGTRDNAGAVRAKALRATSARP
jgi:cyanophycin synthetase